MTIPILLITANVGSIFEDPEVLLPSWVSEFLQTVRKVKPKFLALHCQEVGGKNYEESMQHVAYFVRSLIESDELIDFVHIKLFLDEDFTSTAKFTALGNLYFIHGSITDCYIWNFKEQVFLPASGRDIFAGNIEDVPFKDKDKFPREYFPECKWSRKGFMRTRWKLDGVDFDLINIHLFHDASNFTAIEKFPSSYTQIRQDALEYTLNRVMSDERPMSFFLFGDFNFRLNTGAVIKKLTNDVIPDPVTHEGKGHVERLIYKKAEDSNPMLTIEKKVFDLTDQEAVFYQSDNHSWLLQLDNELDKFKDRLFEFDITFPPSYPFTEDSCGTTYMTTRCPAWCDRILLSHSAKDIVVVQNDDDNDSKSSPQYQMMGADVPMGDHKPILLWFHLKSGKFSTVADVAFRDDTKVIHSDNVERAFDVEPFRFRTNSNPSELRRQAKTEARRISLLLHHEITQPDAIHLSDCLSRTQELLRNVRVKQSQHHEDVVASSTTTKPYCPRHHKHQLKRVSSRLTSHHSSSDEEWYEEMNLLSEGKVAQSQPLSHSETKTTSTTNSVDDVETVSRIIEKDKVESSVSNTIPESSSVLISNTCPHNETEEKVSSSEVNQSEDKAKTKCWKCTLL